MTPEQALDAVSAKVDELAEQANRNRALAQSPTASRTMQQAHLHRATALTGAVRQLRAVLDAVRQPA